MAILSTDNFNTGGPALSANWTTISGFQAPQIVSQVVNPFETAGVGSMAIRTAETYPDDQYAQTKIGATGSIQQVPALCVRGTSAARTHYEGQVYGTGAAREVKIFRYNAGTGSELATTGTTVTVASGDTLKVTVVAYLITVYLNGSSVLSFDDAASGSKIASGKPGMVLYAGNGVTTEVYVDDWEAGDIGGAPITGLRPAICL